MTATLPTLLRSAAELQRAGRGVVACLLVKNRGSTPQSAGSLMLVDENAELTGTIGGGCVEAEVRRNAHRMLTAGETGVFKFTLDHDYGWDDGLICGGTIEVAVGPLPTTERLDEIAAAIDARRHTSLEIMVETDGGPAKYVLDLPPRPRLLIAGAGHIGGALARQALRLEFDVTLFDDRQDLLKKATPDGAAWVAGDIAASLAQASIDDSCYCVIVTRGHRHDEQALAAVVGRGARYVGMIGSRRKVKLTFDELVERGVSREALETVHAPIGLDIGAVSVEEIAMSIAAELTKVRRAERVKTVTGPILIDGGAAQAASV